MVQLAPQAPNYNSDIDYWKLRDPAPLARKQLLSSLGRDTINGVPIDHFRAMAIRQQRGLLIYESCNNDELQKFCDERQLTIQSTDHKSLIETLKAADSHATFRLLDLPLELRCNIYEWYFASLSIDHGAAPLPICQTSQLVRNKSLPLIQAYLRQALRIKCCNPVGTLSDLLGIRDQDCTTTAEQHSGPEGLFQDGHLVLDSLMHVSINASFKIGEAPAMRFRWEIDRDQEGQKFTIQSTHPQELFENCAYGCSTDFRSHFDHVFEAFPRSIIPAARQAVSWSDWDRTWTMARRADSTTVSNIEEAFKETVLLHVRIPVNRCHWGCSCAKPERDQ